MPHAFLIGYHYSVRTKDPYGIIIDWRRLMLALIIQKSYIHYPTNPIASFADAMSYLDYAATNKIIIM